MIPSRTASAGARAQRGIGLVGLLLVAALLVLVAVVGMQVVPTATEYVAIKRATKRAVEGAESPTQVQQAFDRYAAIDDIKSINGKDLDIERAPGGGFVASFRYARRIELFGPASLMLDYHGSSADR